MVATFGVHTESSGFVRHREDDVKPSPVSDCRQRSQWCGEEHKNTDFTNFWSGGFSRIEPVMAAAGGHR